MAQPPYPTGTLRALLDTDLVTEPTRVALSERLGAPPAIYTPHLDAERYATLTSICNRLLPRAQQHNLDLARLLDLRLASGEGNGWRYDALPPDAEAYRRALVALDRTARVQFAKAFVELTGEQQDTLLHSVASGAIEWDGPPAARWFEELLAELVEYFYSDPCALEEIGYAGFADARGWSRIQLNELEAWEPRPGATLPTLLPRRETAPVRRTALELPPMRRYNLNEPIDAVVIGTGAGGAPLLARLASAGLRVVALEAGQFWNPLTDFATDERAQSKLYWNDERLSAGADPLAFGNNNSGIGVGGSTLHYTAYVPRVQPDDLRIYSEFGVGADWPLTYADLEPYYTELERFLGVSGPTPYAWGPPRGSGYVLPPLPLNGAAQLMQRGCAPLGIRTSPAPNAAVSQPYYQPGVGWRAACTNRGFCQAGCSVGAKASMDVTYIPLALNAGAEVRAECFATRLEKDRDGNICAVIYTQNGVEQRQACRNVFLCAGAIETPRLLLINDLANSSGEIGRNFMAHVGVQVWGQFDEDVRPYKGIPGALISEDTHRPAAADFVGGYLLQSIGVMPVTYSSQYARGTKTWGDSLHTHMDGYNHVAGINVLGDCLPYAGNFLELSDEVDARGLLKPRIHFTNGENEKRMAAHAERLMREIWANAGARDVWTFQRSAHIIGTCRMGTDPARSVVNADGRSHDIPNLYIVDNSVFPSALSANPALTIMALALRTADKFIQNSKEAR